MKCEICRYAEGTEKSAWLWCKRHGKHVKPEGACRKGKEIQKMEWVMVTDRVPDDERYVLCCTATKSGRKNMVIGYYSPQLERWCCGMNSNVIAWMELPELPEV